MPFRKLKRRWRHSCDKWISIILCFIILYAIGNYMRVRPRKITPEIIDLKIKSRIRSLRLTTSTTANVSIPSPPTTPPPTKPPTPPTTTPLNRTLWDAKSLTDFTHKYPVCWNVSGLTNGSSLAVTENRTDAYVRSLLPLLEGGPVTLPDKNGMCNMSGVRLEMLYHRYLSSIQTLCGQSARMGKSDDGGWDICVVRKALHKHNCLVYSFGIQFDFSFDEDISQIFGCTVHAFDPSMHMADHMHTEKVHFHAVGLADYNGVSDDLAHWKMKTLQSIRRMLRHWKANRGPTIIKMDIEEWEWSVLPEALGTSALRDVDQLLVEFHAIPPMYPGVDPRAFWLHKLFILKDLYKYGFRIFWIGRNQQCVYKSDLLKRTVIGCYEVSFIREKNNNS